MILRAFYRQGSNFEALVQPLRASARAGERSGHMEAIRALSLSLCPFTWCSDWGSARGKCIKLRRGSKLAQQQSQAAVAA